MPAVDLSSLPAVLKQYMPNYEQNANTRKPTSRTPKTTPSKTPASQKPTQTTPKAGTVSSQPTKQHDKVEKKAPVDGGSQSKEQQRRRPMTSERPMSRERTIVERAKQKKRAMETYQRWREVQRNLKEEDTEMLKRKISLQLQLIRQQHALAEQRRLQEQEDLKQKRDAERKHKREVAEALLRTCHESLETDRQRLTSRSQKLRPATERHSRAPLTSQSDDVRRSGSKSRRESEHDDANDVDAVMGDDEETIATAASPTKRRLHYDGFVAKEPTGLEDTPASTKPTSPATREGTRVRDFAREFTVASTLGGALEEEDEEEEEEQEVNDEEEYGDLPWHHIQLYRLYGRETADDFLHPKVETERKRVSKGLDPRFKTEEGSRLSANDLWSILRGESKEKLLQEDDLIPHELKDTYSCFARESLTKRKKAVRRSFNHPDLQEERDLERMQDVERVEHAQTSRHQLELMFRSSHMNEDRAAVLQFNNPIPDLNNRHGGESVARYLPSWTEQTPEDDDAKSELSYMKWIAGSNVQSQRKLELSLAAQSLSARKKKLHAIVETGASDADGSPMQQATLPQEHVQALPPQPHTSAAALSEFLFNQSHIQSTQGIAKQEKQQKIVFLTEKRARFMLLAELLASLRVAIKKLPRNELDPRRWLTTPWRSLPVHSPPVIVLYSESSSFTLGRSTRRSQSATDTGDRNIIVEWPPLSLEAVNEYKPDKPAFGQGDFRQGRKPVWKSGTETAAA